jgi:hypothetical protein
MVIVTPRPLSTPIVQEAGWAPGLVWTCAENLAPAGIGTDNVASIFSPVSYVTIALTTLTTHSWPKANRQVKTGRKETGKFMMH